MRAVIILLAAILLASCADIRVTKEGEDWDVSYKVLWRESEDVRITKGDITVEFGHAGSDDPIEEIVLGSGWTIRYDNPELDK
jgi:hypothetical protein